MNVSFTIKTRAIPATDTDARKIRATSGETSIIDLYDYALDAPEAHLKAARALAAVVNPAATVSQVPAAVFSDGYTFRVAD